MKFVRRICSVVLAVTLLLPLAPHSAAAATLSVEDRLTQMEQRITQLERALKASTIDVVGLVDKAAPSVVSLYLVDEENDVKSQGTGFIVDKTGLILTNAHVVQGDHTIQVKFSDGTVKPAERKLVDPFLDIAVIQVEGSNYPALPFAQAKPQVGEPVVVIGNAWGYSNSVTFGIVSGVDRPDPYHYHHYPSLQTDAAINHGNSGGPLLNAAGEVVAMATWTELKDQTEGIAFGIPADQIAAAIERFEAGRGIVRPWLGVAAREPYWARGGLPNTFGLVVSGVHPRSAVAKAGLKKGDWITAVNGVKVNYLMELRQALEKYAPGTVITLSVDRANADRTDWLPTQVTFKLEEYSAAVSPLVPIEYDSDTDDMF
jgi:serine protease Do